MEKDTSTEPFPNMNHAKYYSADSIKREIDYSQSSPTFSEWVDPNGQKMSIKLLPTVYPPRKDTDIIANHLIKIGAEGGNFLEIGCGSGVISILAARMGWKSHACDVNPFAVACTIENSRENHADVLALEGGPGPKQDESILNWWHEKKHDLIIWNLPYIRMNNLPEKTLGPIEESALIDNDEFGVEKRFLNQMMEKDILNPNGIIMLLGKLDESDSLISHANSLGLAARIVEKVRLEDGDLLALTKIWHPWVDAKRSDYENIESTNEEMLSKHSSHGDIVTSKHQNKGRGRSRKKWVSTSKCIAATWHLNHNGRNVDPFSTQLISGYIVNSVLSSFTKSTTMLKWPNDIYASNEQITGKLSGILVEGKTKGNSTKIVCGVGVNLELAEFERSDDFPIIGLSDLTEDQVIREDILLRLNAAMASAFEIKSDVEDLNTELVMSDISVKLRDDANRIGQCFLEGKRCEVTGISQKGELRLKMPDGELRIIDEPRLVQWHLNI